MMKKRKKKTKKKRIKKNIKKKIKHCSQKGPYFRDLFYFLGPYWVPIFSVLAEFTQKNSIQFNDEEEDEEGKEEVEGEDEVEIKGEDEGEGEEEK